MSNMRYFFLFLPFALLLPLSPGLLGQESPEAGFNFLSYPASAYADTLALPTDIARQVREIEVDYAVEYRTLVEEGSPNVESLNALRDRYFEDLADLLDEDQLKAYHAILSRELLFAEQAKAQWRAEQGRGLGIAIASLDVIYNELVAPLRELRTRFDDYLSPPGRRGIDRLRRQRLDHTNWIIANEIRPEVKRQATRQPEMRREMEAVLANSERLFVNYPIDLSLLSATGDITPSTDWDAEAMADLVATYAEKLAPFEPFIMEARENTRERLVEVSANDPSGIQRSLGPFGDALHLNEDSLTADFVEVFLLMEPLPEEEVGRAEISLFEFRVYPTPAGSKQTVSFTLPADGQTMLDIIDDNGNVLDRIYAGQLPGGFHRREIDVSALPEGIIYYRLSHPAGTETRTVMIER